MRIVIVGGHGRIAMPLHPLLVERGHEVRGLIGKVDRTIQIPRHLDMTRELLAVVHGHRLDLLRISAQVTPELASNLARGALRQLAERHQPRAPLGHRQARTPPVLADQGISFPMARLSAPVGRLGPLLDADPSHDPAPVLAATAVALAPLALAAKVTVQLTAARPIRRHEPVDPLRRGRQRAFAPRPPGDLLGTPIVPGQILDPAPLAQREPIPRAARTGSVLRQYLVHCLFWNTVSYDTRDITSFRGHRARAFSLGVK